MKQVEMHRPSESTASRAAYAPRDETAIDIVARIRALMPTTSDELARAALAALRERDVACASREMAYAFCQHFAATRKFFNLAEFCAEFEEAMGIARQRRRGEVERTAESIRVQRAEAAKALRARRADDEVIRQAPAELVARVADEVLNGQSRDFAALLCSGGFLQRPAWRGMVAKALRGQISTKQ